MSIRDRAMGEAEKRWPREMTPGHPLSGPERMNRRVGFLLGAEWVHDVDDTTVRAQGYTEGWNDAAKGEPAGADAVLAAGASTGAGITAMARAMAEHECKGKPWEQLHENVREVYMSLAGVAAAALADMRGAG